MAMNGTFDVVAAEIRRLIQERGDEPTELTPETPLAEAGLDSLDLAALVARLEARLGQDPFARPPDEFPATLGQFAQLYSREVEC